MKKKVIVILCGIVLICTAVVAVGLSEVNKISPKEVELRIDELEAAEFYKNDEIDEMYALLASRYTGDELSRKTEAYTLYKTVDKPSRNVLAYIYALASEGADIELVVDICSFWDTTNADIDMIGKIYAQYNENHEKNLYWIEDVYNILTNNAHGVLSKEDVLYWTNEKGMSVQEISTANIMSRKGIYTIQEVLTLHDKGTPWNRIATDIYGGTTKSEHNKLSADTVMDAVYLAKRNGTEIYVYLDKALEDTHFSLKEEKEKYLNECTSGVFQKLQARNLWDLPAEDKVQNAKHEAEMKAEIMKSGISEQEYKSQKAEGVSDIDILNNAAVAR